MRNLEPLGSEFKNIVDVIIEIILWLEIQEGKDYTYKEIVSEELDGIASCVIREVRNTSMFKHHTSEKYDDDNEEIEEPAESFLYLGDSWFRSVNTCINIRKSGHHGCFITKTAHARSPRQYFEQEMKDYPRGNTDNNGEEMQTKWCRSGQRRIQV